MSVVYYLVPYDFFVDDVKIRAVAGHICQGSLHMDVPFLLAEMFCDFVQPLERSLFLVFIRVNVGPCFPDWFPVAAQNVIFW